MAVTATNPTRTNASPPTHTDPSSVKTPPTPEKQAAEKLADFMSVAYQGKNTGWNEAFFKHIAEHDKFSTEDGEFTVPKDVQEAAKIFLAAGGMNLVDSNNNGFAHMSELWAYADKPLAPSMTNGDIR